MTVLGLVVRSHCNLYSLQSVSPQLWFPRWDVWTSRRSEGSAVIKKICSPIYCAVITLFRSILFYWSLVPPRQLSFNSFFYIPLSPACRGNSEDFQPPGPKSRWPCPTGMSLVELCWRSLRIKRGWSMLRWMHAFPRWVLMLSATSCDSLWCPGHSALFNILHNFSPMVVSTITYY